MYEYYLHRRVGGLQEERERLRVHEIIYLLLGLIKDTPGESAGLGIVTAYLAFKVHA